jgi:uncharacterized membrane protein YagU involved in acid resistance
MTHLDVVARAGLLSGALDITATSLLVRAQGVPFKRLLQGISSGALGASAFQGGKKTAAAGLAFHFFIAFVAATVFYAFSRKLPVLLDHPFFSGTFYGIAVHLVMNRIVLPISAAPKREFSARAFLTQLVIHIFFVGLPIALIVSHFSR